MDDLGLPPRLAGRYRPIRRLGAGGMGAVYEVEHVHTGELLALKLLDASVASDPVAVERFRREARIFARVQSETLVRVLDADVAPELGGAPFLVMELLRGRDLARVMRDGPTAPPRVVAWLRQVASALDRVHAEGVIHRDLKPSNLFLVGEGEQERIKLLDFGVAKLTSESEGPTRTGTVVGTPRYMAPEQARVDGAEVGPAVDQWALALIAYALLTGRHYFHGRSTEELLATILFAPLIAPSQRGCRLGPAFDAWFLQSCQRDPRRRFASASAQLRSLETALARQLDALPPLHEREPLAASAALVTAPTADAPPLAAADGSVTAPYVAEPTATGATLGATSTESGPARSRSRQRVLAIALGLGALLTAALAGQALTAPAAAARWPSHAAWPAPAARAPASAPAVSAVAVEPAPASSTRAAPAPATTRAASPRVAPRAPRVFSGPNRPAPDPYASQH